jgi:hypothetical protein
MREIEAASRVAPAVNKSQYHLPNICILLKVLLNITLPFKTYIKKEVVF